QHPAVFGVMFQSAFHTARHMPFDPMQRVTIPDVLNAMETQTHGLFRLDDFVPVPCCMPTCHFVTYALLDGDSVTPLPRILDVEPYLDYLKNRTLPGLDDKILHTLERLWSSSAMVGSERMANDVGALHAAPMPPHRMLERCTACHERLPLSAHTPRDLARHIFF